MCEDDRDYTTELFMGNHLQCNMVLIGKS